MDTVGYRLPVAGIYRYRIPIGNMDRYRVCGYRDMDMPDIRYVRIRPDAREPDIGTAQQQYSKYRRLDGALDLLRLGKSDRSDGRVAGGGQWPGGGSVP